MIRLGAALLAAILAAGTAAAHGRSTSTSAWEVDTGETPAATIRVQVAWPDVERALPHLVGLGPALLASQPVLAAEVDAYLQAHVRLEQEAGPCPVQRAQPVPSPDPTHVVRRWRTACESPGEATLAVDLFHAQVPAHLHLARLRVDDAPPREHVFVLSSPTLALAADGDAPPQASSFGEFVVLGVEHILTGWDHLVFLLALLLVGASLREVATIVTGFTVAHSVTLALGVLGVVEPQPSAVEALIGLSIAVVALENASLTVGERTRGVLLVALAVLFAASTLGAAAGWLDLPESTLAGIGIFSLCYFGMLRRVAHPLRLRWLLAFVFGLVHGFGFAGILTEMALPRARLAPALLGFNVGVELGQLALVALCWPLLRVLLGGPEPRRHAVVQVGSAVVLAAGLYWFASRALAS